MADREVNLQLLEFLVDLATDQELRARFDQKSERPGIYQEFQLNEVAINALEASDAVTVDAEVNHQVAKPGTGGGGGNG